MQRNLMNFTDRGTVILLTVVGLLYRILHYAIFSNKIVAGFDTMQNIQLGRKFASGDFYGVLDTYWPPVFPVLIGAATFLYDDLIIPTVVVSIITGAMAVPLTYYFVQQSYGSRAAVIASVLAIFFPYLINSVFAIGTENIYLLWVIGALAMGWKAMETRSAVLYIFVGFLVGLAYLTRPEAIGYVLFFVGWVVVAAIWGRSGTARDVVINATAIIFGFALLSIPYFAYLKAETGSWTISGKTSRNLASGVFSEDASTSAEEGKAGDDAKKADPRALLANYIFNLREAQNSIVQILPLFLIVFSALGLFGSRWSGERFQREAYLLSFCIVTVLGYAAAWVLERYLYVLLPVFFGWIALGIIRLEQWFRESASDWPGGKYISKVNFVVFAAACLIFIFFYVFSINFYVRSADSDRQARAYEERDAGIWLRQNARGKPKIFAYSYRAPFYADGIQYVTKSENINEILDQIKQCNGETLTNSARLTGECRLDYVVSSERTNKNRKFLGDFDAILQSDPAFELVYERNDYPGRKISVFKIR